MCFSSVLCVCVFFFGVWKREKRVEKLGRKLKIRKKKKKSLLLSGLRGAWGYL